MLGGDESIDHPVTARHVNRSAYDRPCETIVNGGLSHDNSSRAEGRRWAPRLGPPTSRPDSLFGKLATSPPPPSSSISFACLSVPLRAGRVPRPRGTCHRFRLPPTSFAPIPSYFTRLFAKPRVPSVAISCVYRVVYDMMMIFNADSSSN